MGRVRPALPISHWFAAIGGKHLLPQNTHWQGRNSNNSNNFIMVCIFRVTSKGSRALWGILECLGLRLQFEGEASETGSWGIVCYPSYQWDWIPCAPPGYRLNDGFWHSVALIVRETSAVITIDDKNDASFRVDRDIQLRTGNQYFFGGGCWIGVRVLDWEEK